MPRSTAAVTVRAPAKVNLHLGVGTRREDGYHEVVTVLQAVSLYDDVTISPGGRAAEPNDRTEPSEPIEPIEPIDSSEPV
nr:hypothetical protein [Micromonospora sp. DSM 115978]